MIVLDTDHLSVLVNRRHSLRTELLSKLDASGEVITTSIVSVEEQLRGWLAQIHRLRDPHRQIVPYVRLAKLVEFLSDWRVLNWNEPAADVFVKLRRERIRVGTQDLKIAAVALANDAILLSANLIDFQKIPGLRVEDWLRS